MIERSLIGEAAGVWTTVYAAAISARHEGAKAARIADKAWQDYRERFVDGETSARTSGQGVSEGEGEEEEGDDEEEEGKLEKEVKRLVSHEIATQVLEARQVLIDEQIVRNAEWTASMRK